MTKIICGLLIISISLSVKAVSHDKVNLRDSISGIYCKLDSRLGSRYDRHIDLGTGGYIDNHRHYLWVEFNEARELSFKIFKKRKHVLDIMDRILDDKVIFEDIIALKDLSLYQDDDIILEYDLDYENRLIGHNIGRVNEFDRISCYFTRNGKVNTKIYLDNKIKIIQKYKDRRENLYKYKNYKEANDLYYLEALYEQGEL